MAEAQPAVSSRAREYETIYILRPDVPREGAERVSSRVKEVVSREGGMLTLVEVWGRRQLAYRVSRYRRGVYVYLKFIGQGGVVREIERTLRMMDDVIKYQTVKVRDDVDTSGLTVPDEDVQFEVLDLPEEEEEEAQTLARSLGLEEAPREGHYPSEARGDRQEGEQEPAEQAQADPRPEAEGDRKEDAS